MPRSTPHPPRWYAVPFRVLLLTFIGTLLTFAVSLLFGILGTIIVSAIRGHHPNMTIAYRNVALPAAVVAAAVILVAAFISEVRRYRQVRALAAIERLS